MSYIGSTPTSQNFTSGTDYFSGTGSQTAFTLTRTVNSVNDIEVVINNVVQQPSTAYTLSGTTVTFTSAPSSGTNNIYVRYLATNMQSFTVPANSISRTHLDSNLQAGFQGRNKIINGAMTVAQRGTSFSSLSSSQYCLDRFSVDIGGGGAITVTQSSTAPTGFTYSKGLTVATVDSSIASGDAYRITQSIEGFNVADLGWGTANAKPVTLSFWVRSSITGTYGIGFANEAETKNYVATYTIDTANTWEYKTITIVGDTGGTWLTTNGAGIGIRWDLGSGTNYNGTAGTWQTTGSKVYRTSSCVNWIANSGATFYITGVQLEEGTTATSFEREAYSVTLQKCQRYYYKRTNSSGASAQFAGSWQCYNSSSAFGKMFDFPVTMRATPTATVSGNFNPTSSSGSGAAIFSSVDVGGVSVDALQSGGAGGSSGLTAGNATTIAWANGAFVAVSAEL